MGACGNSHLLFFYCPVPLTNLVKCKLFKTRMEQQQWGSGAQWHPQQQLQQMQSAAMLQWNQANSGQHLSYPMPYTPYPNNIVFPNSSQMTTSGQSQMTPPGQPQMTPPGQPQMMPLGQSQMMPLGQSQMMPPGQPQGWPIPPLYYPGYPPQANHDTNSCAVHTTSGSCCANKPLNPYCCGPSASSRNCLNCFSSFFDRTFLLMVIFALLAVIGFVLTMVFGNADDVMKEFNVLEVADLQKSIEAYLQQEPRGSCNSYGGFIAEACHNGAVNAHTLVFQNTAWNRQRNAMYCLSLVYSVMALLYAALLGLHKKRYKGITEVKLTTQSETDGGDRTKSPKKWNNLSVQGATPTRNGTERSAEQSQNTQSTQAVQGQEDPLLQSSGLASAGAIHVYGTPYFEFVWMAWFVMGVATVVWTWTLMTSFWGYVGYYQYITTGRLNTFFADYNTRFSISVMFVSTFLAWPVVKLLIEFLLWIVFFLPWLLFRSVGKPGIGNLRPALPLSKMPGYIRLDMFFMDFADARRLGFSESTWSMLTGTSVPCLPSCCDESMIDRDPNMPTLQQQQQLLNQYGQPQGSQNMTQMTLTVPQPHAAVQPPAEMVEGGAFCAPEGIPPRGSGKSHSGKHRRHGSGALRRSYREKDDSSPGASGRNSEAESTFGRSAAFSPASGKAFEGEETPESPGQHHRHHQHHFDSAEAEGDRGVSGRRRRSTSRGPHGAFGDGDDYEKGGRGDRRGAKRRHRSRGADGHSSGDVGNNNVSGGGGGSGRRSRQADIDSILDEL
uniref:Uncharacterized protein n=1 Tax=Trypanosoma vivax (strain Y486) TaxID=1055687 RepID=G0TZI1_TRYVY|nr:conserved hypothetical protein [Trypanosoma vivax Y486]